MKALKKIALGLWLEMFSWEGELKKGSNHDVFHHVPSVSHQLTGDTAVYFELTKTKSDKMQSRTNIATDNYAQQVFSKIAETGRDFPFFYSRLSVSEFADWQWIIY